ncbi:MAG: hypothetical protein HY698_04790 [Deltaproteobacteria bacterium]|nr:hypothetical protein [Deltaproteobacteria bacterium]
MREQLRLLEELQRYDAHLQEFESALKALPEKLQSMKADLAKVEALLEKEQQGLADTEKFRREQEAQLKVDEASIGKAKAKLQQVKNSKDYMAAQREVEATRKLVGEREEEILRLIEAIESTKKSIAAHETDVAQLREHVVREEGVITERVEDLRQKVVDERQHRDAVATKVRADVLKRYGTIRMRRGLAVVPVVMGVCQGCHMAIPPQLYNTLQRGNSIEPCPNCHRIVYWDELMKDKELERGEESPAVKPE